MLTAKYHKKLPLSIIKRCPDLLVKRTSDYMRTSEEESVQFSKNVTGGHIYQDLICGFIAGVKWPKEQMMKDVTTATCCGANAFQPVWCFDDLKSGDIAAGDKIKVIIIKEEEQC